MTEQEDVKPEEDEGLESSPREIAYKLLIAGLGKFKPSHYIVSMTEQAAERFSVEWGENGREIINENGEVLEVWDSHSKVFDDPAKAERYAEQNIGLYPEHMKIEKVFILPQRFAPGEDVDEKFEFSGSILTPG